MNAQQLLFLKSAASGDLTTVKRLIESGVNPSIVDDFSRNALHFAASNNKAKMVEYLLGLKIEGMSIDSQDTKGNTALHFASAKTSNETINILMRHRPDLTQVNLDGRTAAHIAGAVDNSNLVLHFIRYGADVNQADTATQSTLLHFACAAGNKTAARIMWIIGGDLTAKDKNGRTPAELAKHRGHTGVYKALNRGDKVPATILRNLELSGTKAQTRGFPAWAIARALVHLKLDPGLAPCRTSTQKSMLHIAAAKADGGELLRAIIPLSKAVNGKWQQTTARVTPLDVAIKLKHVAAADIIVRHGGVTAEDRMIPNKPELAAILERISVYQQIFQEINGGTLRAVQASADALRGDWDFCREDGVTPLHAAVVRGREELVAYLIEVGHSPRQKDRHGQTMVEIAREYHHDGVVGVLENKMGEKKTLAAKTAKPRKTPKARPAVNSAFIDLASMKINTVAAGSIELGEKIAQGSMGTIYRGVYSDAECAVKEIVTDSISEAEKAMLAREIAIHQNLQHVNIIQLLAVEQREDKTLIAMQLASGSLHNALMSTSPMSWEVRWKHARDIAVAMKHIYSRGIQHRDLKSLNVLLVRGEAKVTDFGLSIPIGEQSKTIEGSWPWMAPERFSGTTSEASDVFSFGILLWEIAARGMPFHGLDHAAVKEVIMEGDRPPLPDAPFEFLSIMTSCWAANPAARPTFAQLVARFPTVRTKLNGALEMPSTMTQTVRMSETFTGAAAPVNMTMLSPDAAAMMGTVRAPPAGMAYPTAPGATMLSPPGPQPLVQPGPVGALAPPAPVAVETPGVSGPPSTSVTVVSLPMDAAVQNEQAEDTEETETEEEEEVNDESPMPAAVSEDEEYDEVYSSDEEALMACA